MGANSGGLALNITFAGTVSISAAGSDGHAVKVSTAYLGGLGLLLGVRAQQNKAFSLDSESIPSDPFLKNIYETNLNSQKMLSTSETGVLVAHGSATGSQMTTNNGKLESGLIGGFVVGNVYGLGAGAVADINGGKNGNKNVDEKQEVKTITEPLYEKYMKSLSSKDSSAGLLVLAEGLNAGEAVIATREGWLDVKGASGFKLGSYTEISTRG
ncbi:unnamed protein product [Medioppia subpectinata]|uniref:Uncharacterized protein n=1 Tax=Medioppia subpectinata TaxID=1979941 RepID=A0A7R9L0Q7_9ACAR|nr:unnamed protein product [Medioppia subpectinata]CAG2113448.1 unnamed protein product [Medioppia subpectinata]